MPISGVIVRLRDTGCALAVRAALDGRAGIELGDTMCAQIAAVIDAHDYAAHDLLLSQLRGTEGVCAVDIVFHDFSDVRAFPRLPTRQRNTR